MHAIRDSIAAADTLATRKAQVFNGRFPAGAPVLHIHTVGEPARWDRTYGAAFVRAGRSMVFLASEHDPVETDRLYSPPPELACIDRRLPLWQMAAAAVVGFGLAVLALAAPPAHSVAPEQVIVIECDEPGEAAPVETVEAGKAVQS